jgi:hypothetical protein
MLLQARLAATTRAYVKIIEEVNKLKLKDVQLPEPSPSNGNGNSGKPNRRR